MQACHITPHATGRKVKYIDWQPVLYGEPGNPNCVTRLQ